MATNAVVTPIVRMLPGNYTTPLDVRNPTASPLQIVAAGAQLLIVDTTPAINVRDGASIEIRDVTVASAQALKCNDVNNLTAPISSIAIDDSALTSVGNSPEIDVTRCNLTMRDTDVSMGPSSSIGARTDSVLDFDRVHVHGNDVYTIITAGTHVDVRITNSLLENTSIVSFTNDGGPPGSHMTFAYDTFVLNTQGIDICGGSTITNRTTRFENTIFGVQGAFDAITNPNPANCTFVNALASRQMSPPSGMMVADPAFIDPVARDYHLQAVSPAVDRGIPGAITSSVDLDGVPRPQGTANDIGAYELP